MVYNTVLIFLGAVMASKTIEQFVIQLGAKGIEASENTVRRKLKLIGCTTDDLQDIFAQAFVVKMLQDGFEAAVFAKVKKDSVELVGLKSEIRSSHQRIESLENEVRNLKDRLERLENTGKVVSIPENVDDSLRVDEVEKYCQTDDGLKPWERAFNAPQYDYLMKRYHSIPETDDRHLVNWITNLTEDERVDFYDYAKMDWDDPNHPRFR